MNQFTWTQEYETGIPKIDEQHRELFKRMDKLVLAVYNGSGEKDLMTLVDFLESYVEDHFSLEEELMLRYRYSEYSKHKEEHRQFTVSFDKLKNDFYRKGGDRYLAINAEKILSGWWKKHILGSDMRYVPEIADRYNRSE